MDGESSQHRESGALDELIASGITGKRSNAVPMFAALDREILPGPLDVAKVIEVLRQNGVTVHA